MNLGILLPVILIVGVMFMMNRSMKNKQRQAEAMRGQMEPGAGVRTIGGMYAVVKEVNEETVLLEITDGVHAHFAKNAIGTVLTEDDFNRIVHGIEPEGPEDGDAADGEASEADGDQDAPTGADLSEDGSDQPVSLGKAAQGGAAEESAERDGSEAPAEQAAAGGQGGSTTAK